MNRLRREDGISLIETMIAAALGLVVVGAAVMVFTAAVRSQPRLDARASDIAAARTTMERLTRELRQGSSTPTATASQLSIVTYVDVASCGGAPADTARACRVTYACGAGTCTRTEASPDGTGAGPPRTVVTGLMADDVFSYAPVSGTPGYVGVKLVFGVDGAEDSITLHDGVDLRNLAGAPA